MTEDEILSDLGGDSVTHIRRLTSSRDWYQRDTNLLALTFSSTSFPDTLVIGLCSKDVRVFVPSPVGCYKCQRFGHGSVARPRDARSAERLRMKAAIVPCRSSASAVAALTTWSRPLSAQYGKRRASWLEDQAGHVVSGGYLAPFSLGA